LEADFLAVPGSELEALGERLGEVRLHIRYHLLEAQKLVFTFVLSGVPLELSPIHPKFLQQGGGEGVTLLDDCEGENRAVDAAPPQRAGDFVADSEDFCQLIIYRQHGYLSALVRVRNCSPFLSDAG